jgi:hypothetical protein
MTKNFSGQNHDNVVDLFSGQRTSALQMQRYVRLAPEYDGICMLYSNHRTRGQKLYTLKILSWALKANGEVVGLVPWLNRVYECNSLDNPVHGQWEGYYDEKRDSIFYQPPAHKVTELQQAAEYFPQYDDRQDTVLQEIPDTIGTHAMLDSPDHHNLILTEVISWQLRASGEVLAMLIDEERVTETPVLMGDPCLYAYKENPNFRFFFQHHIANQIKSEDPEALAAIALLFDH